MKRARDNKKALNEIRAVGGSFAYRLVWPEWVRRLVGDDDYFFEVLRVTLGAARPGQRPLPRMDDDQFQALMPALRQFPRLIHLNLGLAEITDRSIDDITTLTQLRLLYLEGTHVTDGGVAKLQRALPNCEIHR